MNYSELIRQISESVLKSVKQILEQQSHSDKTFQAQITSVINPQKYTIKYCGVSYTVSSQIQCNVGDTVRVCAPCSHWNDLFLVENKSSINRLAKRKEEAHAGSHLQHPSI